MPRTSFSCALPCLVVNCNITKPCNNKTFHDGSVFELDVVLSSGCAWAWLGGSSSSQILRETVFVHEGPAIPTPEETPSVEI